MSSPVLKWRIKIRFEKRLHKWHVKYCFDKAVIDMGMQTGRRDMTE